MLSSRLRPPIPSSSPDSFLTHLLQRWEGRSLDPSKVRDVKLYVYVCVYIYIYVRAICLVCCSAYAYVEDRMKGRGGVLDPFYLHCLQNLTIWFSTASSTRPCGLHNLAEHTPTQIRRCRAESEGRESPWQTVGSCRPPILRHKRSSKRNNPRDVEARGNLCVGFGVWDRGVWGGGGGLGGA